MSITYVVKRGFVSEIRCTLAEFMGGVCGQCEGNGGENRRNMGQSTDWYECDSCSGTGRTPGAVEVFRTQPVRSVVLSDCRPWEITNGKDGFRWFGDDNGVGVVGRVHKSLIRMMDQHQNYIEEDRSTRSSPTLTKSYPSADAALAALSAACVRWGRREAKVEGPEGAPR